MNRKNTLEKQRNSKGWQVLPLIFIIAMIPFIVRLKAVNLSRNVALYWTGKSVNFDFFSYGKSAAIIFIAVVCFFLLFFMFSKTIFEKIKDSKFIYGSVLIYILLVIISSMVSTFKSVAIYGGPDRYEGMWVLISYAIILVYAMNIKLNNKTLKTIVYAIYFLVFIMGIIGLLQYIGKDFFATEFAKTLIFPKDLEKYKDAFNIKDMGRNIYGTSYHYNYMGSLTALLLPFCTAMTVLSKEKIVKTVSAFASIASAFLLFASTARSGLIGVAFSFFIAIIFFRKELIKKWKYTAGFLTAVLIIVVGLNLATSGAIFQRIPSLAMDIAGVFNSEKVDYRDSIPLKSVEIKDDRALIKINDDILEIADVSDGWTFYDISGTEIPISTEKVNDSTKKIILQNSTYRNYIIESIESGNTPDSTSASYIVIGYDNIKLYFKKTDEGIVATNFNGREIDIKDADYFGFEGKERLGSGRGYIWSRTIPLLKNSIIIGYGPDTFFINFPQNDVLAKHYVYGNMWEIVDKPHNLYLQIAYSTGVVSLIAFLVLIGRYFWNFFKNIKNGDKENNLQYALKVAFLLSVCGYLGAGLFNDSVVSVAPLFWVFLGLGINLLGNVTSEN